MPPKPPPSSVASFHWVGSDAMLLDTPTVTSCGRVAIGRYGGHTGAGADKNEDGALIWCPADGAWEFAVLLDAHDSAQSAALVLDAIAAERAAILDIFGRDVGSAFVDLHAHLLALFRSPVFRTRCRQAMGEASCLICARKGAFLWWLSIGDCVAYLLHPHLARLGQFALNQRQFYEWVGHDNTFDLPVPCYTTGTRHLPPGASTILMLTDGLLECGRRPFEDPRALYALFAPVAAPAASLEDHAQLALRRVVEERGRDSATLLAWHSTTASP